MGLKYIENRIRNKTVDIYARQNDFDIINRIIRSAQIISKGRCGGKYHIVDAGGILCGSIAAANQLGVTIHTTLMAAINAARYISGTTSIDYTDTHQATVIILPGDYSAEGRIAFSAKNVHIIGLGLPGTDTGVTIRPTSPTTFVFGGSGTGVEIANIGIAVDSAVIGLFWEMMDGSSWFHDNKIMGDGANATYGIYTEGVKSSTIENNIISGFVTSGITVAGGADRYFLDGKIVGNQIGAKSTCATAIYVAGAGTLVAQNALIAGNYVIGDNFTKTIDVDNTAADVMVAHNYLYAAGEGGTSRGDVST